MDIVMKMTHDQVITVCEETNEEDKKSLSGLVTQLLLSCHVCEKEAFGWSEQ